MRWEEISRLVSVRSQCGYGEWTTGGNRDRDRDRKREREGKNRIEKISGEAVLTTTLCCTT